MFDKWIDYFEYEQTNEALQELEVASGSTFNNCLQFLLTCTLLVVIHMPVLGFASVVPDKEQGKLKYYSKLTWKKIYELFTFTIYIRILLQSYQFLLLSSVSELYNSQASIKMIPAVFIAILWVGVYAFSVSAWIKKFKVDADVDNSKIKELFADLKPKSIPKGFNVFLLTRRILFVTLLICFQWLPKIALMCIFLVLQFGWAVSICIFRPLTNTKDNIVEIYNEILFTTLVGWLTCLENESDWTSPLTYAYLALMMSAGAFLLIVSLVQLGVVVVKKIAVMKAKRTNISRTRVVSIH